LQGVLQHLLLPRKPPLLPTLLQLLPSLLLQLLH
jgi:hypothetical protein